MKNKIYYHYYTEHWKEFFESKRCVLENYTSTNDNEYLCFIYEPYDMLIQIYSGDFREDTKTHGCICIDFKRTYNKVFQCPIYVDLDIDENKLWKALDELANKGEKFSQEGKTILIEAL